jgi:KipI family sensor histidine kinase inhibitor
VTRATPAGDAALLVEADGPPSGLAAAIASGRWPGILDVIPGARTVLVTVRPGSWDLAALASRIQGLPRRDPDPADLPLAELPVCYDGPDLAEVARLARLSTAEVIARHAAAEYTVGWLGFSPGFGYLTGLDPALRGVPRLAQPRLRVPAGSVAIAGGLTAVYPSASPGGWRLLGRTTARLWDPDRDPPALLAPGMRVRFRPAARLAGPPAAQPAPAPAPGPPSPPRRLLARPSPPPGSEVRPAGGGDDRIEVIRPGALATVQDLGRTGFGHLGVRRCGAADSGSLRLANRLVGNPDGAAGLEFTLGRAVLRCTTAAWFAVTGAPVPVSVRPGAGRPAVEIGFGAAFWVPAGGLVQLGAPPAGVRTYLAARGGIDVPEVLGSRSTDLVSGLGPPPLRAGDVLPLGPAPGSGATQPAGAVRTGEQPSNTGGGSPPAGPAVPAGPARLTVIPGPRADWFAASALEVLCRTDYTVTPYSDRTGLRLEGPVLARARAAELPSEGMVPGALQVPPSGQPILLLADHPVTGGYPVIAVVRSADLGLAAQLRPGQRVRFAISRG